MSDPHNAEKSSCIQVIWRLPDGTSREQTVPDMERLMSLLRMPDGVTIDSSTYQIADSTMTIEAARLSVVVTLA